MPPGCSCCHFEEGLVHEARLVSVVTKTPQEAVLDQEAVSLGYLVQWPRRVLTPYFKFIQLLDDNCVIFSTDLDSGESQQVVRGMGKRA